MDIMHYIGLDIHKKIIAYCVKTADGAVHSKGMISATRSSLNEWMKTIPRPWMIAMEATLFTGWIYDFLKPHASEIKVAHPEMLKAITVAKRKMTSLMPKKYAICSEWAFCRSVTWPRVI